MQKVEKLIGVSPSGKATDSDSVIREFKSLHPSQKCTISYSFGLKTLGNSAFFVLIFARIQLFSPNFGLFLGLSIYKTSKQLFLIGIPFVIANWTYRIRVFAKKG